MNKKARLAAATVSAAVLAQCVPSANAVTVTETAQSPAVSAEMVCGSEDIVSGGEYTIMVRLSGKFVTAGTDGNVHQWENLDNNLQRWKIVSTGEGKCAIFSAADPSQAMTVENGDSKNGNSIVLAPYEDTPAQHFILHRTDDAWWITAECSGRTALDVYDISHENGANIDQWDYWGGEGQKFYIRPVDDCYSFVRGDLDFNGRLNVFDRLTLESGI